MNLAQFVEDCLTEILEGIKKVQAKDTGGNIGAALSATEPRGLLMETAFGTCPFFRSLSV